MHKGRELRDGTEGGMKVSEGFLCGLCGAHAASLIYEEKALNMDYTLHNDRLGERDTRYHVCKKCGTVAQFPLPGREELEKYYATVGTVFAMQDNAREYKLPLYEDRVRFLGEVTGLKGGRALEVAAGGGAFLDVLRAEMGMEVLGIEPSEDCNRAARETLKVPMIKGVFENVDLKANRLSEAFDLVVSMHVLEHVLSPTGFFEKLAETLIHGGYLYIEVPSSEYMPRLPWIDYGQNINPGHLAHFSGAGIVSALAELGMTVVHMANTTNFGSAALQVVARKMDIAEMGAELFLKQVANKDAVMASAARLMQEVLAGHTHVVLWGAGTDLHEIFTHSPELADRAGLADPGRYILVDRNPDKHGKTIAGVPIQSPAVLKGREVDCVAVTVSHSALVREILRDVGECLPGVECVDLFSTSAHSG